MKTVSAHCWLPLLACALLPCACRTISPARVDPGPLEDSYAQVIERQNAPDDFNQDMLKSEELHLGQEFWELYFIYSSRKGAGAARAELDRIVGKHGITTTLVARESKPFLSDGELKQYLDDASLQRTEFFKRWYGDPVIWERVVSKRNTILMPPLKWPPEGPDDYFSKKARNALGLEYPKPFR